MYLVRRGQVRLFLLGEDGHETTTAIVGPGHLVGLAPLLGQAVYHEIARALTSVEAWALPTGAMREHLARHPALLGLVMGSLARRLGVALGLLHHVTLLPVGERVRDIELRLGTCLDGSPPALRRPTLAELVQARAETLARTKVTSPRPVDPSLGPAPQAPAIDSTRRSFRGGEVVVQADLPPGHAGVVLDGQLRLSLAGTGGRAWWSRL